MPFDSLHVPPDWMPQPPEPERPLSIRDRVVALALGIVLAVITLANCRMLVGAWHGW